MWNLQIEATFARVEKDLIAEEAWRLMVDQFKI